MNTKFTILLLFATALISCAQQKSEELSKQQATQKQFTLQQYVDTTQIDAFFIKFPLYKKQRTEIKIRYQSNPSFIWFDKNGIIEFAGVLYNQATNLGTDGLTVDAPYLKNLEQIIYSDTAPSQESELLLSCLYFFYTNRVFVGLDSSKSQLANWYLPRETKSYASLLDSLAKNPKALFEGQTEFFSQYYNLRTALQKYRKIEKAGGWQSIDLLPGKTVIKPNDSASVIGQVRKRLFIEGYLSSDSEGEVFDDELSKGIEQYYNRIDRKPDYSINNAFINALNIPVEERIKTIMVNMERCRWISPRISDAPAFIAVNIPSYQVHFIRKGRSTFTSRVVVGTEMNNTVVFSGDLAYVVFSPYWNVPKSILQKEILPAIQKNPKYLAAHNMEWYDGRVRQKPGLKNSLGLVKFMFPNSNNIYLHDTPAKSLFAKDDRAFSHGCIRVEKARELAIEIMSDEANWTPEQVDAKMNAGKESSYSLKKTIPVYIAYFTAWADQNGNIAFYKDIYNRDERLLEMLHN